ncbi:MAG: hypothetical protein EXR67_03575 [Dehalococcoidia bacterium]|nr:hypothetical protein [Dehalococcoidia bacterium]
MPLRLASQITPPQSYTNEHASLRLYVDRAQTWFRLEHEYCVSLSDAKRLESDRMIPEIDARDYNIQSRLLNAAFAYQAGN